MTQSGIGVLFFGEFGNSVGICVFFRALKVCHICLCKNFAKSHF